MHATGFDRAAQRAVRRQQALLPDHFVEGARAHALGQRAQVFPIDAQQIGTGKEVERCLGTRSLYRAAQR
jgi:hypothetical protein